MTSSLAEDPFPVSLCTPADIPELYHIWDAAFSTNPFHKLMFPATLDNPTEAKSWYVKRATGQMARPETRVFKVTEASTGKIAAFARWKFPHATAAIEKKEAEKSEEEKKSEWPVGTNIPLCEEKFGMLDVWREQFVVDKESIYVAEFLATSPQYQRKGLGTKLMKAVLDLADAEGRKAYIEASPDGYPVYSRLGFRDVAFSDMDAGLWGGEGVLRSVAMIREPVSKV